MWEKIKLFFATKAGKATLWILGALTLLLVVKRAIASLFGMGGDKVEARQKGRSQRANARQRGRSNRTDTRQNGRTCRKADRKATKSCRKACRGTDRKSGERAKCESQCHAKRLKSAGCN